jgi:SAM-dependent methyltransferase
MTERSSSIAMARLGRPVKRAVRWLLFQGYIQHHRILHALRVLPYSRNFGFERGTPVGRYYVEAFLRKNADQVSGRCLEFGDDRYRTFFPGAVEYCVTDIGDRPGVDYPGDIHDARGIPQGHFDAIICIQVFEHLAYPEKAAQSLYRLLSPGGVLLLTAPFLNPVHYVPTDFRRFTPECLKMILEDAGLAIEVLDFGGNALVGTGSLLGMVREDFSTVELDAKDPVYPYNVLIRARKPDRTVATGGAATAPAGEGSR